jgi:hypothetical protein
VLDAEAVHQDPLDELVGVERGELAVEALGQDESSPSGLEQREAVVEGAHHGHLHVGRQEPNGVGREGQHRWDPRGALGDDSGEQHPMAEVDAVEVADGDGCGAVSNDGAIVRKA